MNVRPLSEIVLVVRDVAASARFYGEVVGLALEREPSPDWAWFRLNSGPNPQRLAVTRHTLLFEEHSPRPTGNRWGPTHFAFQVSRAELLSEVERLKRTGLVIHGPTRLEWMKADSYYFYDPDANLVELWSPDLD